MNWSRRSVWEGVNPTKVDNQIGILRLFTTKQKKLHREVYSTQHDDFYSWNLQFGKRYNSYIYVRSKCPSKYVGVKML